ncbi:MAG TPA: aminotransferase class I/II-fold pyridoxal phosphate-dependent enzyme [Myxococcota bacterium]|nr:aminotransferase class I/II-fold pyridoxal phosphate-dependent enzyme [Myxococcota bacterium]
MSGPHARFDTLAVHGVAAPDVPGRPVVSPIVQSASFHHEDVETLGAAINEQGPGFTYSRLGNPTVDALGRTVAALEGAAQGVVFGSGMAAITAALLAECAAGDRVLAPRALYGGTYALLARLLPRWGIETTFVDYADAPAAEAAMAVGSGRTRVVYAETIANPTMDVPDLARLAALAHAHEAALVVDSTFASPWLCRPIEHGADVVVHSATKYLSGHGDVVAGVVATSGARAARLRKLQAETGGVASPFTAWLTARGVQTLPVRMERHCATAMRLAQALAGHPGVETVHYPGLATHPDHEVAARQLRAGRFGGMLGFDLRGGVEAGRRFQNRLQLVLRAGSLGDVHSLALHPASTSHRQLDPAARQAAGIGDGYVRLSVGLEDPDDILEDLTAALA